MENRLAKLVKDIYQRLRSNLSALKNTLVRQKPSAEEKPKESSSSRSPRALPRKLKGSGKGGK